MILWILRICHVYMWYWIFWLRYLNPIGLQRSCHWCPHINPVDCLNYSCQCSRERSFPSWFRMWIHSLVKKNIAVWYQDPTLAVCTDAVWFEWSLGSGGRTSVKKTRSFPAWLTTTTARALLSYTQISKFLFSLTYFMSSDE